MSSMKLYPYDRMIPQYPPGRQTYPCPPDVNITRPANEPVSTSDPAPDVADTAAAFPATTTDDADAGDNAVADLWWCDPLAAGDVTAGRTPDDPAAARIS
jgi:hypothetical protein